MRLEGKIINWNDDRGFGFVEPNGGGDRAFVHIKEFKQTSRRPADGEIITYELVRGSDKRYKAKNVKYAADLISSKKKNQSSSRYSAATLFSLIFIFASITLIVTGRLDVLIGGIYLLMSIITYIAYSLDKSAAKKGGWRTKESTLHLCALMGGWPGALLAQKVLRHKSSKQEFKTEYWITVFLNLCIFLWLLTDDGALFFKSFVN